MAQRIAEKVLARKPRIKGFPSDEESVLFRQQCAATENARVDRTKPLDEFHGAYSVSSRQWAEPYLVEIRSLNTLSNSCSCQDFGMSRLGTCKHIERVLQSIAKRKKRAFTEAAQAGSSCYEVFFDSRTYPPQLRLLAPRSRIAAVEEVLAPCFGSDGLALGEAADAWKTIEAAVARMDAAHRRSVRLSAHAEYWLEKFRLKDELNKLRTAFENDVASGKRSDSPSRLPLYPYQRTGMIHLAFTGRALLADEMGLGKTVQAIAAVELLRQLGKVRRVLVVSPASLKGEWEEQIERFTGIHATPIFGGRAARLRHYMESHAYCLCNYEQILQDVDDINRLLVPDLVILDEAQRIKNWPTKTAKHIKRIRSPFAFVLTGTPLENRIEELYSLVEFVDPHLFGSLFRFQRDYMRMEEDGSVRPIRLDDLHRRVLSVMLRRRKSDVEDSLPERSDKNFLVDMEPEQRKRYAEFEYEVAKIVAIMKRRPLLKREQERLQILLGCMRMVCDTPYILDPDCRICPKLKELDSVLDEALEDADAKIIIFSEWVRMLDLVKELLDEKGIGYTEHSGRIPQMKRREHIRRFKHEPSCRVFLSSESGGTGLNLQVANTVINLDLPWNPAKLEQRIARAWRKHQTRCVRVINLIAANTIEHAMLGKLAYKQSVSDAVLDGAAFEEKPASETGRNAFAARVSELLSGESAPLDARAKPASKATRKWDLKEHLCSRHADRLVGIETDPERKAALVIVRSARDADAVRRDMEPPDGAAVEVLDSGTLELLKRLVRKGLIAFAPRMETLYAAPGYRSPLHAEEPKHRTYPLEARAHWRHADKELRAARALVELGLNDQASSHWNPVARIALESLLALHAGMPGDAMSAALDRFQASSALAGELQAWLRASASPEGVAAAQAALMPSLVERLEETLR